MPQSANGNVFDLEEWFNTFGHITVTKENCPG